MKSTRRAAMIATVLALASTGAYAQTNRVLYLDGVDDYLQIQRPVSNSFTFEVWVNLQTTSSNNATPAWCGPIYDNHYNHGDEDFGFYMAGRTPGLAIGNPWAATSSVPVNLGSWVHVAAVRDVPNTEARVYINGNLVGSQTVTDARVLDQEPTVWIGRNHRTAYLSFETRLHAYIDECRLWNRALTQGEIQSNMFNVLSGSEAGLVTYLNFDSNNFNDKTPFANHATASGSPAIVQTNAWNTNSVILAAEVANVMGVQFSTTAAQWYSLHYNTNLVTTNWYDCGLRVLGDGGPRWFFDPAGFSPLKFYKVKQE